MNLIEQSKKRFQENIFFFFFYFWAPVISYMVIIFSLSSQSHPSVPVKTPDYLLHGIEYFILNGLLLRALFTRPVWEDSYKIYLIGIFVSTLYGVSDEIHQYFVPYREFSFHDMIADFVGAVLAAGVFYLSRSLKNQLGKVQQEL
jgi:VanZ family protein